VDDDHGLPRRRRGRLRRGALAAAATVLAVVGGSLVAGQLLIGPDQHPVGPPPADLAARDVVVPVGGGRGVHGWLAPGRPGRGGVLLVHGLGSDRRSMLPRARWLHGLGYTVLLVDLRGHGESPGSKRSFSSTKRWALW